ncbi:hypothetical protein KM043_008131 [Ampulex compressa]|nr:hypothetical protein KM043_008131 [Ampulex compressa]
MARVLQEANDSRIHLPNEQASVSPTSSDASTASTNPSHFTARENSGQTQPRPSTLHRLTIGPPQPHRVPAAAAFPQITCTAKGAEDSFLGPAVCIRLYRAGSLPFGAPEEYLSPLEYPAVLRDSGLGECRGLAGRSVAFGRIVLGDLGCEVVVQGAFWVGRFAEWISRWRDLEVMGR